MDTNTNTNMEDKDNYVDIDKAVDNALFQCASTVASDIRSDCIRWYQGWLFIYEKGRWHMRDIDDAVHFYDYFVRSFSRREISVYEMIVIACAALYRGDTLRYTGTLLFGWIDDDFYFGLLPDPEWDKHVLMLYYKPCCWKSQLAVVYTSLPTRMYIWKTQFTLPGCDAHTRAREKAFENTIIFYDHQ